MCLTPLHAFTLTGPSRYAVDITVPPGVHRDGSTPSTTADACTCGRASRPRRHCGPASRAGTCISCGYSWHVVRAPAGTVVRVVASSVVPPSHAPGTVGFPYESRFVLRATGAGFTSLCLEERPPQQGAPPVARYRLRFTVAR